LISSKLEGLESSGDLKGDGRPPVLVIGAGPAGLATAACLVSEGIPVHLVDRDGAPGGAYRRIYPATTLLSAARYLGLIGLEFSPRGRYTTADEYRGYVERYAAHHGLAPRQVEVERVERVGGRFRVHFVGADEPRDYEFVVAATGMFDHPVWPEISGLARGGSPAHESPQILHARGWPGPAALAGRKILIIGGGTSAVEIAEECARARLRVAVAARRGIRLMPRRILGADLYGLADSLASRLPRWVSRSHCVRRHALPSIDRGFRQFRRMGLISVRGPVTAFEGPVAVFADGSREPFDVVVLATGYRFATPFLPAEIAPATSGHRFAESGESPSWPGLFFVGFRCARALNSEFLRGIAQDAPAVASQIRNRLTKKA
jgi:putative flavoprotein involved in K+ transport